MGGQRKNRLASKEFIIIARGRPLYRRSQSSWRRRPVPLAGHGNMNKMREWPMSLADRVETSVWIFFDQLESVMAAYASSSEFRLTRIIPTRHDSRTLRAQTGWRIPLRRTAPPVVNIADAHRRLDELDALPGRLDSDWPPGLGRARLANVSRARVPTAPAAAAV